MKMIFALVGAAVIFWVCFAYAEPDSETDDDTTERYAVS